MKQLTYLNIAAKIKKIIEKFPSVKLLYFFGSRATKKDGPMSDYDFAVFLDEKNSLKRFDIRLELYSLISRALKTDKIDLLILNDLQSPELKFNIINEGKLLYIKEPYQLLVEPKIINEFIDFKTLLTANNL